MHMERERRGRRGEEESRERERERTKEGSGAWDMRRKEGRKEGTGVRRENYLLPTCDINSCSLLLVHNLLPRHPVPRNVPSYQDH